MRKVQWTQTIIIILLIQTEQIPTSEQNNEWICMQVEEIPKSEA